MSQGTTTSEGQAPTAPGRVGGAGGQRLAAAFEAVSQLPALAQARDRVLALSDASPADRARLAEVVEADAGLAVAVMRAANNGRGPRGRTGSLAGAIAELEPERLRSVAATVATYELLDGPDAGGERFERFRRHALATRMAAELVAQRLRLDASDELAVAALFHDVGRLVLGELYGEEMAMPPENDESPEARLRRERRELGVDHALVGGVLIRRWGLPPSIATAVERHHASDAEGFAAVIRLADLIVHHAAGDRVPPRALREAAGRLGLSDGELCELIFDFPRAVGGRLRPAEPCPLSPRELDALRGLGEGKVYKQIAAELGLSVSTVRTHLHNVYRKIGAVDRAQAVLLAREKNWL